MGPELAGERIHELVYESYRTRVPPGGAEGAEGGGGGGLGRRVLPEDKKANGKKYRGKCH